MASDCTLLERTAPKFSVVSINMNNAGGLAKTLKSIEGQVDSHVQVIVIDGRSTDESKHVIAAFPHLVSNSENDEGQGVYAAMNQGVMLAKGEWTIFLNSGDSFYSPVVLREFSPAPTTQLAYGRAWVEGTAGPAKYNGLGDIWRGQPFCHQALFTRTEILRQLPFDTSLSIASDYKFLLQAYRNGFAFEDLDQDICWIEPPGLSGKRVHRRLLEKYCVAREFFPEKPLIRNSVRQLFGHYRRSLRLRFGEKSYGH